MNKFGTIGEYPKQSLASAEAALLTAWPSLERYHDDLVLKLNAFGGPTGRRAPKDAYDVLLAVTRFVDGPEAAVAGFRAEANAGNTGYEFALNALKNDFSDPGQDGPIRAAAFLSGDTGTRDRIREDVATVGRTLLEI